MRKLLLLFTLGLCLPRCALAPATIHVHDSMWPVKITVEKEARAALGFYCDVQGIDDCAVWQHGLTVYIVPDPTFPCDDTPAGKAWGCYTNPPWDYIEVVWGNGPGRNAFLHELLHREEALAGNRYWYEHPPWFLEQSDTLKQRWRTEVEGE